MNKVPEETQQLARQVFAKELAQEKVITERSSKSNGSGSMGYFFQLRLNELLEQIRINGHIVTFEREENSKIQRFNVNLPTDRLVVKEKNVN